MTTPASTVSKTKTKVTAPAAAGAAAADKSIDQASATESTINRDAQERLTYGDACKLISRLLVANDDLIATSAAIREVIEGTGLPFRYQPQD